MAMITEEIQFIIRDIFDNLKKNAKLDGINPPNFNYTVKIHFEEFLGEYLIDDVLSIMSNLHDQTLELVKYEKNGEKWNAIVPIMENLMVNHNERLIEFFISHYWLNKIVSNDYTYKDVDVSLFVM